MTDTAPVQPVSSTSIDSTPSTIPEASAVIGDVAVQHDDAASTTMPADEDGTIITVTTTSDHADEGGVVVNLFDNDGSTVFHTVDEAATHLAHQALARGFTLARWAARTFPATGVCRKVTLRCESFDRHGHNKDGLPFRKPRALKTGCAFRITVSADVPEGPIFVNTTHNVHNHTTFSRLLENGCIKAQLEDLPAASLNELFDAKCAGVSYAELALKAAEMLAPLIGKEPSKVKVRILPRYFLW